MLFPTIYLFLVFALFQLNIMICILHFQYLKKTNVFKIQLNQFSSFKKC